jgi:hypothetical protein
VRWPLLRAKRSRGGLWLGLFFVSSVACTEPAVDSLEEPVETPDNEMPAEVQMTLRFDGQELKSGDVLQLPEVIAGQEDIVLKMDLELQEDKALKLLSEPPVVIFGADAALFEVLSQPDPVLEGKSVVRFELKVKASEMTERTWKSGIAIAWGKKSSQRFSVALKLDALPPEYVDVPFAVAVGEGGRISVSWDRGETWLETLETENPIVDDDGKSPNHKMCFDRCWKSVSILPDRIVIAGLGAAADAQTLPKVRVWESFDGQSWQPVTTTAVHLPGSGVMSPMGQSVFVGGIRSWFRDGEGSLVDAGYFGYSDEGSNMNSVAWFADGFLAVGDGGRTFRTSDGVSWDLLSTGGGNLEAVASNGERLVAVGKDRRRVVSLDGGLSWAHDENAPRSDPSGCSQDDDFLQLSWDGNSFVTYESYCDANGNQAGRRHSSVDGLSWQQEESNAPHADIVATAGMAAGIGRYPYNAVHYASDGLNFTSYKPEQGAMALRDVAAGTLRFRKDEVAARLPGVEVPSD